jgi:hypothetical protein
MRNQNHLYDKAVLYYGTYRGAGAIFSLFCFFFITIPIRLVRLLLRTARR